MLCKGTVWQGWSDGCNRIYHVRKWTSRALGVRICQEFSGTNDIRTCIQPCTASSFLDTAGFSIHSLQVLWCSGWAQLCKLYEDVLHGDHCIADAVEDPAVVSLDQHMKDMLGKIATLDKTAQLWVQYFSTVTMVRNFIRSERTGDWPLHLDTITKMLPFFHASGHLHYAKSAHLYHQEMCSLHDVMDMNLFQAYTEKGLFTIRRSDKFWSGVWSDMIIEQVLMRAMKVSGGLTRGRGITLWLSGYVLCHCVYHCALQVKSSLAAILSPLSSILRHLITKTWDQHNRLVTRQIWSSSSSGLKRIYHFPGIMVAS